MNKRVTSTRGGISCIGDWAIWAVLVPVLGMGRCAVAQDAAPPAHEETSAAALAHASALSEAFRGAAERIMPCTVKITSRSKAKVVQRKAGGEGENRQDPFEGSPFKGTPFEELFKDMPGGPDGFEFRQQVPARQGLGSGIILDSSGVILTNNHVVSDADEVTVTLKDGREFQAREIKTDPQTDLAILRIDAKETLPAASLGNSDLLQIGDWVITVGHPFDYEQTVSAGIVSGLGRDLNGRVGSGLRSRFIQTDAAINPGNSGGPLVNLNGEVVGINTAIASSGGGFQGLGFAVPINIVKWAADQLVKNGRVDRAGLGVFVQDVTADMTDALGVLPNQGVAVTEVLPGSPAAEAGIQPGDVILKVSGKPVHTSSELRELAQQLPLESVQEIQISRGRKVLNLKATMRNMPALDQLELPEGPLTPGAEPDLKKFEVPQFGFQVAELTAEQAKQLGAEAQAGVYVVEINTDGPASASNLRTGMRVLQVENQPVNNLEDLRTMSQQWSDKSRLVLLVDIGPTNRFVAIRK